MIHPGKSCTDFNAFVVQLEKMYGFSDLSKLNRNDNFHVLARWLKAKWQKFHSLSSLRSNSCLLLNDVTKRYLFMNTFYKACKSCFSNRKLFQPFASITWQEEKRNVDEMEVTTTTKRYKSLALSFFTFLRLSYVFLFWAPVLWMLLMDSKDRSLLSCMSPPLEHTFLFAIWVCLFVF